MATGPSVGVDLGFIDALPDLSAVVDSRWRVVASSRTVRNFVAADVSVDDLVAGASARVQLGPVASAWVHVAVKDITYSVRSSPLGVDLWLITCRPYEGGTILHRPAGLGRDDAVAADVAADVEADVSDIARTRAAFAEATHRSIAILDALDERVCVLEPVMANGELIDLRIVALNRMQREAHGGVFTEGALASVAFVGGTEAPAFAAAREALAGGTPLPYRVVRGNSSFDDPDQRVIEVRALLAGELIVMVSVDRSSEVELADARVLETAIARVLPQSLALLKPCVDDAGRLNDFEISFVNPAARSLSPEGFNPIGARLSTVMDALGQQWSTVADGLVWRNGRTRMVVDGLAHGNPVIGRRYIEFDIAMVGEQLLVVGTDRTEAEVLNRRVEAYKGQLGALYEALPDPVMLFAPDGAIVGMNAAAARAIEHITGSHELRIGDAGLHLTTPNGEAVSIADRWAILSDLERPLQRFPIRAVTPSGVAFDFLATTRPVDLTDGRKGVLLSLADVTALAAATKATAVAEAQLREILVSLGEAVMLLSPVRDEVGDVVDAVVISSNPAAEWLHGVDAPMAGKHLVQVCGSHLDRALDGVRRAVNGNTFSYSIYHSGAVGKGPNYEFAEMSFYPAAGGLVVAMLIDRTEQQRSEALQRRTSDILAGTLEHMANGLAIFEPALDSDGGVFDARLTYENSEMRRMRREGCTAPPLLSAFWKGTPLDEWARAAWASSNPVHGELDNRAGTASHLQNGEFAITVVRAGEVLVVSALDRTTERDASRRLEQTLGQLIEVAEAERRTLAVVLHDGAIQALVAARIYLIGLQASAAGTPAARNVEMLTRAIDAAIDELRNQTFELFPPSLEMSGLPAALTEQMERFAVGGPVIRLIDYLGDQRIAPTSERLAFRTAQELLRNVVKHAQATTVDVTLIVEGDMLRLDVVDNGCGFDTTIDMGSHHFGVVSCRQLLELAGGSLTIESAPGAGTHASALLPIVGLDGAAFGRVADLPPVA